MNVTILYGHRFPSNVAKWPDWGLKNPAAEEYVLGEIKFEGKK